ncbi:hypothetical protein GIB67_018661 [Kingdonia uniflora]|uniref:TsaA-like domain-containing protein n=1 Tax=Kingdonia uniflora TaxID=39325 RepID=A0A7J7M2J4_9MAGN|nr:hypothetical protein GIB67_018661 [Kingdonia uniflora]
MAVNEISNWSVALTFIAIAAISVFVYKRKSRSIRELEISLKSAEDKCNAERQGRIRAQQALRKALTQDKSDKSKSCAYPMTPIASIQSCFSTRNGTPRQPLLVPLARACMVFDTSQVPPAALQGLGEYSHIWILYVFHLNTNLDKLWKEPSKSKFKAKVFCYYCISFFSRFFQYGRWECLTWAGESTNTEWGQDGDICHQISTSTMSYWSYCCKGKDAFSIFPSPIEAVQGHMVLLSGVDLVDGTPVLDIKPYLPYCDSVQGVTVPKWVKVDNLLSVSSVNFSPEFSSSLADCWVIAEKSSLYASPDEFQSLIKQVLSWDIRSLAQRKRPHNTLLNTESGLDGHLISNSEDDEEMEQSPDPLRKVTYHLMLEGLDISYKIDGDGNIAVDKAALWPDKKKSSRKLSSYTMWRGLLG